MCNLQSSIAEVKYNGTASAEPCTQEWQSRHFVTLTWCNICTSLHNHWNVLSKLSKLTPAIYGGTGSTIKISPMQSLTLVTIPVSLHFDYNVQFFLAINTLMVD